MKVHLGDSGDGWLYVFADEDGAYDVPRELIDAHDRARLLLMAAEQRILRHVGFADVGALTSARRDQ